MFKKWFLIAFSDPAPIRRARKRQPGSIWKTRCFRIFPMRISSIRTYSCHPTHKSICSVYLLCFREFLNNLSQRLVARMRLIQALVPKSDGKNESSS